MTFESPDGLQAPISDFEPSRVGAIFAARKSAEQLDTAGAIDQQLKERLALWNDGDMPGGLDYKREYTFPERWAACKERVEWFGSIFHLMGRKLEAMAASPYVNYDSVKHFVESGTAVFDRGQANSSFEHEAMLMLSQAIKNDGMAQQWNESVRESVLWRFREVARTALMSYDLAVHGSPRSREVLTAAGEGHFPDNINTQDGLDARPPEYGVDTKRNLFVIAQRINYFARRIEQQNPKAEPKEFRWIGGEGVLNQAEVVACLDDLISSLTDLYQQVKSSEPAALYKFKDLYEDSVLHNQGDDVPVYVLNYVARAAQKKQFELADAKLSAQKK
ncbi:MAG: hypothetical protein JNK33_01640 [Candidatus Doudnabacteria bacterium]|nr:hypothetical protein [Candidatus Doudnabacteria bacterium]